MPFVNKPNNMPPITKLSEHIQSEELHSLERAWQYLTPLQRKYIVLSVAVGSVGRKSLIALDAHIQRRRMAYAYYYPAHWIRRTP